MIRSRRDGELANLLDFSSDQTRICPRKEGKALVSEEHKIIGNPLGY